MSKELPYFKFYVNEWITGTISLEDFATQGMFIDLCSYYWSRKGDVTNKMLHKKYALYLSSLDNLIDAGVVQIIDDVVHIDFLDEQMEEYDIVVARNTFNGKKGGRPPKKTETQIKPPPLLNETQKEPNINLIRGEEKIVDNSIKEDSILEVKFSFRKSLIDYGFDKHLVDEWLMVRKAKKSVNTLTALNSFINEVEKASEDINEILKLCVSKSWAGFKNEWLKNINTQIPKDGKFTNTQQSREEALRNF